MSLPGVWGPTGEVRTHPFWGNRTTGRWGSPRVGRCDFGYRVFLRYTKSPSPLSSYRSTPPSIRNPGADPRGVGVARQVPVGQDPPSHDGDRIHRFLTGVRSSVRSGDGPVEDEVYRHTGRRSPVSLWTLRPFPPASPRVFSSGVARRSWDLGQGRACGPRPGIVLRRPTGFGVDGLPKNS